MEPRPQLVALIGGSGAGKTWLARRLQRSLGPLVTRIAMDEFYLDHASSSPTLHPRTNSEHPRTVDWHALHSALQRCRAGRATKVPQHHSASGSPANRTVAPRPIVLVDGIWLLVRRDIRALFDFRVFLECPAELRLERRVARDLPKELAGNGEAARRHFWRVVEPMHQKHVLPQAAWADIVMQQPPSEQDVENLAETLRALTAPDPEPAGVEPDFDFPQFTPAYAA